MDKKDKMMAYWLIGAIVLILVVWLIYAKTHKQNQYTQTSNETNSSQSTASSTPVATSTPGSKPLSYGDAVKAYPNRFQFVQCQATPSSMVVKKGAAVMLDNRDNASHTIKADGQTFYLGKYSYAVLHTALIGNLPVTCDGKTRVTLNVEK